MTTYGVTTEGFAMKRLQVLLEELKESLRDGFGGDGVTVVTGDESGFGILAGIVAKQLAEVWELAQAVYSSAYPSTSAGAALDNVLALANLRRLAATKSTAWSILTGDSGTVIPENSLVEHDASGVRFRVTADVTLDADDVLGATIDVGGASIGAAYTITIDGHDRTISAGTYDVNADIASALAAEIDQSFPITAVSQANKTFSFNDDRRSFFAVGKRCRVTGGTDNDGEYTVSDIDFATGVTTITVTEAIPSATVAGNLRGYVAATASSATITLVGYDLPSAAGDASAFAFAVSLAATGGGALAFDSLSVPHEVEAVDEGPVEAAVETLTIIATPVSGWTSTSNLIAADEGNLLETDVDARQRRARSLQVNRLETRLAGLSGVDSVAVYYNDTGTADGEGRPGHSIECVVEGGDDLDIAEMIYETKAAGIQTWGTSVKVITDSQGITRTVLFSRPTDVNIYVGVTVDSTYAEEDLPAYPSDAIKEAIVTYGATLASGTNVIASRLAAAVVLAVPGLDAITVKIGTSPTPSASTTISITDNQRAVFDEARITVTGV